GASNDGLPATATSRTVSPIPYCAFGAHRSSVPCGELGSGVVTAGANEPLAGSHRCTANVVAATAALRRTSAPLNAGSPVRASLSASTSTATCVPGGHDPVRDTTTAAKRSPLPTS